MSAAETWESFVLELATQPELIDVLTGAHLPTADGLCRACTTPGRGTPRMDWPCALWTLANDARKTRQRMTAQKTLSAHALTEPR